jgi:hypothetical protein
MTPMTQTNKILIVKIIVLPLLNRNLSTQDRLLKNYKKLKVGI